jgi:hypothetical protein
MAGYVVTVDSPYFSAADERGAFAITGAPAGTYTYHAWRPGWSRADGHRDAASRLAARDPLALRTNVKKQIILLAFAGLAAAAPARSQSLSTELDLTSGFSS